MATQNQKSEFLKDQIQLDIAFPGGKQFLSYKRMYVFCQQRERLCYVQFCLKKTHRNMIGYFPLPRQINALDKKNSINYKIMSFLHHLIRVKNTEYSDYAKFKTYKIKKIQDHTLVKNYNATLVIFYNVTSVFKLSATIFRFLKCSTVHVKM